MAREEKKKFNQIEYQNEYNRKMYDEVTFRVQKGMKAKIKEAAASEGRSMNDFIAHCVFERMGYSEKG